MKSRPMGPHEAMTILVECMAGKSGQSYKVRNLLYSLWNGQSTAALVETRALDYELKHALCVVILHFGLTFEYDDIINPIKKAGLFDWFISEYIEGFNLDEVRRNARKEAA